MKPDFKKMDLIPAIIQDYKTNEVLMLAYVNKESYEYMLKNKRTCFYSRSRKKLWIKGETSGNFQYIKSIYLDCDNDTLLIKVKQIGNACHTGSYSCFFSTIMDSMEMEDIAKNNKVKIYTADNIEEAGNDLENFNKKKNTLKKIYDKIKNRSINPIEKSYTNYLLEKGIDKICKKVGEEATETVIAAKNDDDGEFIGEVADLVYHTLVLMFCKNITVEDVEQRLLERHNVDGNKKVANVRGDY